MPMLKTKLKYDEIKNTSPDNALNDFHSLSLLASQANGDALCYCQEIKVCNFAQLK